MHPKHDIKEKKQVFYIQFYQHNLKASISFKLEKDTQAEDCKSLLPNEISI